MWDEATRRFVADTAETALKNNVSFNLVSQRLVNHCHGYFDENELVCCTKGDFLPILVHESCHMDQWLEKEPLYTSVEDVDNHKCPHFFKSVLAMEIDCEQRALKKIKKYGLDIDTGEYLQSSNAYMACHFYYWKLFEHYNKLYTPSAHHKVFALFPKDRLFTLEEAWRPREDLEKFFVDRIK